MEPLEGSLEFLERTLVDDIAAGDVTKLEECRERSDDIWGDVAFNRIQINLGVETIRETLDAMETVYLH